MEKAAVLSVRRQTAQTTFYFPTIYYSFKQKVWFFASRQLPLKVMVGDFNLMDNYVTFAKSAVNKIVFKALGRLRRQPVCTLPGSLTESQNNRAETPWHVNGHRATQNRKHLVSSFYPGRTKMPFVSQACLPHECQSGHKSRSSSPVMSFPPG